MLLKFNIKKVDQSTANVVMYSASLVEKTGMILSSVISLESGLKSVMMTQRHPIGLLRTPR